MAFGVFDNLKIRQARFQFGDRQAHGFPEGTQGAEVFNRGATHAQSGCGHSPYSKFAAWKFKLELSGTASCPCVAYQSTVKLETDGRDARATMAFAGCRIVAARSGRSHS